MTSAKAPTNEDSVLVPVILTLIDGETLKGSIRVKRSHSLGEVLNGTDHFILFQVNGGHLIYLSQKTIAAVQSNSVEEAHQLDKQMAKLSSFNPLEVLHLQKGADREAVQAAYHKQVKKYHPDQYASTPLPDEITAYLEAVIMRLTAAHRELIEEIEREEKLVRLRAQKPDEETSKIHYFGQ